jgi:hypothetical protein
MRLQAAPLRNLPTWQINLSQVVREMESYSTGDLDGEAIESHDEENDEGAQESSEVQSSQ